MLSLSIFSSLSLSLSSSIHYPFLSCIYHNTWCNHPFLQPHHVCSAIFTSSSVLQQARANENGEGVIACDCHCERKIGQRCDFDGDRAPYWGVLNLRKITSHSFQNQAAIDCISSIIYSEMFWELICAQKMGWTAIGRRQVEEGTAFWQGLNVANKDGWLTWRTLTKME